MSVEEIALPTLASVEVTATGRVTTGPDHKGRSQINLVILTHQDERLFCISPSELMKQTGLVRQHDAREFMEMLLNNMNDPFVTELFQVETTCSVHCLDCGNVSKRQDVTKMLNVPLGNGMATCRSYST